MKEQQIYEGLSLHSGQQKIVDLILRSSAMFYTICTPRQWGKSTFLIQLVLYFSINFRGSNILITSLTYKQTKKIKKLIQKGLKGSGVISSTDGERNSITLINGTEIIFASVHNPDSMLGEDIDFEFLDEAARYKEETFTATLKPMLFTRGKKCFLISTPKGKNWFYKLFMYGKDPLQPRYECFKGVQSDNPFGNKDELEDAKRTLPSALYRQEYLAEFVDGGGDVFDNVDKCATLRAFPPKNPAISYYAGVDVARKEDYTVITILGSDGKVYAIHRYNGTRWSEIADKVAKVLKYWNPKKTLVEINGVGDVFFELLKDRYKKIEEWLTSNKSKQQIIEELILAFQDSEIEIPTEELFEFLVEELSNFGFEYSAKTRNIFYAARTGHDDCVMSLAMSHHAKKHKVSKGWSM